jgi:Zn-finger nucleic acid-binding protein
MVSKAAAPAAARKECNMKCPNCPDARLAIAGRHGVELDYCPQCRGVWLDRGELDKLMERAAQSQAQAAQRLDDDFDSPRGARHRSRDHGHRQGHGSHARRRNPRLEELFD